jgi:SAM-dependent methyltransferase
MIGNQKQGCIKRELIMPPRVSRLETLRRLRMNKHEIGLSLSDLSQLDNYLQEKWDIRLDNIEGPIERLKQLPEKLRDEFLMLYDERVDCFENDVPIPLESETRFYDVIAQDPLNGIVHSQKRPIILDGMAWVRSLLRHLKMDGPMLDIGCHTGYQSIWFASQLEMKVDAVDRSAKAISYAQEKSRGLSNVLFEVWDYHGDDVRGGKYDVIICSDACPTDIDEYQAFLKTLSGLLEDDGVVILIDILMEWFDPKPLQQCALEEGFGFGVCDVVGGWNGMSFGSRGVLALVMGGSDLFPDEMEDDWVEGWDRSGFQDYANSDNVPPSQKSLAYFRAQKK